MPVKILIVDDNQAVRHALRVVLESNPDFTVCGEAENGQVGVDLAQRLHPDAIILDLSMPVMNGMEAARILKGLMPATPILMFTSFAGVTPEALNAGAWNVVLKSDAPAELIRNLRVMLKNTA